jgi:hypothetical protein
MKKFFFLFALLGLFAFTADAQKCSKATAASKEGGCCAKTEAAAAKAAKMDDAIVRQVSDDGTVKYTRKEVCSKSGKVSYTDVEYCTKSSKFVNVSPSEKKAACTKKTSATKVSSTSKKACCAKGGKKASCSKKEANTSTTEAAEGDAKVKLVKGENE